MSLPTSVSLDGWRNVPYFLIAICHSVVDEYVYGVETRRLNEAVKRNLPRFPETFMFQLTHKEIASMRSQIRIKKRH